MMPDDMVLVREFAASQSERAFETLVSRHIHLVYSAALRRTGDAHLAEEITQAVFIILARKAKSLDDKTVLSGWLYRTAQYAAADALKIQRRRRHHEQEAHMQSILENSQTEIEWREFSPLLDEAMMRLRQADRDAIVLRYFENKNLREVGAALDLPERTAQKRIARALEKLRTFFAKRGVASTTAIIAGAISTNSVQAAPVALAKSVTAVAIAKGATASISTLTLIKGALEIMAWTKVKTAVAVGACILLATGTTMVTFTQFHQHDSKGSSEESWRSQPNFSTKILEQAPPQVKIINSKFSQFGGWGKSDRGNVEKMMGLCAPMKYILHAAYDFDISRMVFLTKLPSGRYDFIASLPSGNAEALQQTIKEQFGLTGRPEMIDTNVLVLGVISQQSMERMRSRKKKGAMTTAPGEYKCEGQPVASLSGFLEFYLGVPVVDQTGLIGNFDIDLKWSGKEGLKQALIDQLGLELVQTNMPVEMLVVTKDN